MRLSGVFLEDVIIAPITTEKTTSLREGSVYVFRIAMRAGKMAVKHAVEKQFSAKVANVRIVNVKPKVKNVGVSRKRPGRSAAYKKAYVRIADGGKISELEA